MKLDFRKIHIHNFMSYIDEEFDLGKKHGLCLICGKNYDVGKACNGSGKSSLFYALVYCLYGQLQTSLVNKFIKNRYAEDPETFVELYFVANKVQYHLKRSLNRSAQTSLVLKKVDVKHGVEVDLNKSSVNETQDFLEREILHCDISIFLRTVLLSSDQTYNFFTLKPAMKRDFIEKLFNIGVFTEMYKLIHNDNLKNKKEIVAGQNRMLVLLRNAEDYKTRKEQYEVRLNEERKEVADRLAEARNGLCAGEGLSAVASAVSTGGGEAFELYVKTTENELQRLADTRQELNRLYNKLRDTETAMETKLAEQRSIVASNSTLVSTHSTVIEKLCDKCRPVVRKFYNIENAETSITDATEEIDRLQAKIAKAKEKLVDIQCRINETSATERNLMAELSKRTIEVNNEKTRIARVQAEISGLESKLEEVEQKIAKGDNPYTELLTKNNGEIETENGIMEKLETKKNYLSFSEDIVNQDSLKKFIVRDLVGVLNSRMKHYLSKMGALFTCEFDENMDYKFTTSGGECDYNNFSAGERMRLMIASCLSFRDFMATRNNLTSNILILDEYIDSNLDTTAIDGIMSILKEFKRLYGQNIFVISHRKEIDNSQFDSIVMVEKRDNTSTIHYLEPET